MHLIFICILIILGLAATKFLIHIIGILSTRNSKWEKAKAYNEYHWLSLRGPAIVIVICCSLLGFIPWE